MSKKIQRAKNPNFERALKSMTCVQKGSIHIDSLKNVKKIQNGPPLPWQQTKIPEEGQKMSPRRPKYLKIEKECKTKFLKSYCDIIKQ